MGGLRTTSCAYICSLRPSLALTSNEHNGYQVPYLHIFQFSSICCSLLVFILQQDSIATKCHKSGGCHFRLFGFIDFTSTAPNRNQQLCDGTTDPNLGPICGKPFALSFSLKGYLYIADAYFGLLVVGPNGGLATQLATSAEGVPFRFLIAVDVDLLTGTVYFTDSSEIFELRQIPFLSFSFQTAFKVHITHTHTRNVTQPGIISDSTGRLMRYEPLTRQITLLLRGLAMPSGVSVSIDGSFVLVSEDTGNRIQKYWLRGFNGGTLGILLNLPGNPTKIRRNLFGDFWVPVRILGNQQPTPIVMPHGLKINQFGTVLANVSFAAQYNNTVSVVLEHNGALFAGSRFVDFVGVYTY
ncbi:hypothetical protein LOK49_LG14G00311 [Camellia lanceoleosa]|uniref:Uncharacterized protein n=1 Tax=Camellia lanceoleosa TaxID=1840588 RepID=A0ACC0FCK5_9ERIC|nr:hypothetical protein LOK49_LG14G00311 [Camellia lanceoleosa]